MVIAGSAQGLVREARFEDRLILGRQRGLLPATDGLGRIPLYAAGPEPLARPVGILGFVMRPRGDDRRDMTGPWPRTWRLRGSAPRRSKEAWAEVEGSDWPGSVGHLLIKRYKRLSGRSQALGIAWLFALRATKGRLIRCTVPGSASRLSKK